MTVSHSISNRLSLEQVVQRLTSHPIVDGIALFGSQAGSTPGPVSDYDLLILVKDIPLPIFQMLTSIAGRMADLVFIETKDADRALESANPVQAASFEGMFLLKMRTAQILYDAGGRLLRAQQLAIAEVDGASGCLQRAQDRWAEAGSAGRLRTADPGAVYAACFWANHTLQHIKRMIASEDPVYLTAVDMMLAPAPKEAARAYFVARQLPWQGEKAAVRHLQEHDPGFLALLESCLAEAGRNRKLEMFETLLDQALRPVGGLWEPGVTAVFLRDPQLHPTHLPQALQFWESLLQES